MGFIAAHADSRAAAEAIRVRRIIGFLDSVLLNALYAPARPLDFLGGAKPCGQRGERCAERSTLFTLCGDHHGCHAGLDPASSDSLHRGTGLRVRPAMTTYIALNR